MANKKIPYLQIELPFGANAGFPIKGTKLDLTLQEFRADADIAKLQAGAVVALDTDGTVKLATEDKPALGFLVLNVRGNEYENCPCYASGLATVAVGGGIYTTNNVTETDIKAGDALYAADNTGLLTKNQGTNTNIVGIALTANSSTDKTIRFKALV